MKLALNIYNEPFGAFPLALGEATRGDRIVYHIGPHCGGPHKNDAMAACDAKMCFLFCQRVGEGRFAYVAVKR